MSAWFLKQRMTPESMATKGMPRFMREHTRANPFLLAHHVGHGAPKMKIFDQQIYLPNSVYAHELGVNGVHWKIMELDVLIHRLQQADADILYEEGFEAEVLEITNSRQNDIEDTIDFTPLITEENKAIYRNNRNHQE